MAQAQNTDPTRITAEQRARWTDHTPVYADIVIHKDRHDWASQQVVAAVTRHGRISAGSQVLDVASNAGRPAVPLAKVLPEVNFVSTDLAPSSTALALEHAKAEGVTNVTAQTADAQDLHQFADASFAAVTCTYGLLFMPDYPKALEEAHRVLHKGGLYAATLWGEPEQCQMIQLFVGLVEKLVGPEVASRFSPPGIKHASDLPQHLQEAGFKDITSTPYSHPLVFTMDDLTTFLLGPHGQFGAMLDKLEASGRTGIHQAAQQMLKDLCQERMLLKNNTVTLRNTSFLFTGVKP